MTRFEILRTSEKKFRWVLRFVTRFNPIILYGNEYTAKADCEKEMEAVRDHIADRDNLEFIATDKGYCFTVSAGEQQPVAASRRFASKDLMKRVLKIVRKHIAPGRRREMDNSLEIAA